MDTDQECSHSCSDKNDLSDDFKILLPSFNAFQARITEISRDAKPSERLNEDSEDYENQVLLNFIIKKGCDLTKKISKCSKAHSHKPVELFKVKQSNPEKKTSISEKLAKLEDAAEPPMSLTKKEILDQFNFDIDAHLNDGEVIEDDHKITV